MKVKDIKDIKLKPLNIKRKVSEMKDFTEQ